MNWLVRFALVAFFPPSDGLPGLAELEVDDKIAMLRRESTRLFWFGIVAGATLFQLTPMLTVRRPWPAAFLTPEQLDAHANKIASHPIYPLRQIMVLIKLVGGMFWGQSPEVRAFLTLPPYAPDPGTRRTEPCITRPDSAPRAPSEWLVQLGHGESARGRAPMDHPANAGRVV